MGNKLKKLKEMYKDMCYNKQFIFLFILIESTVIIEIFTIPPKASRINFHPLILITILLKS